VPLVHKVYGLYKLFHLFLKFFPKQEKYTLGQMVEKTILEMLEKILVANYAPKYQKCQALQLVSQKNDLLKYLIRLAYDIRCLNSKKYLYLEKEVIEIGKMLGGWLKSVR